jgi:hypothetical protein
VSRVRGVGTVRALLRKLPDAGKDEILVEMNLAGRDLAGAMRGRTPFRTGALQAAIGYRVLTGAVRLIVGIISTPKGRSKLFYGRVLNFGRPGQGKPDVVQVRRLRAGGRAAWTDQIRAGTASPSAKPSRLVSTYAMRVGKIPAMRFVTGRYPELRRRLGDNLRAIWDRALKRSLSVQEFD